MSIEAKSLIDSLIDTYNPTSVLPFIGSDGFYHFLYLTYHKDTYKFYIGKHTTPDLDDGYIGSGKHFIRALNKHGKSSFINIRLLFLDNEIEAYLKEAELVSEEFIRRYRDELKVCYNLQSGGSGGTIYLSEDTRAKIKETNEKPEVKVKRSQASKESHSRPEVKAKISKASKKSLARPEVKAKISKASKESHSRPEVKAKHSQSLKEANARPEVKAKRSQASKEAQNRPEVKAKMSQSIKESHSRPEVKAKISKASKESLARPEVKAKHSQSLKEALASPEARAKRSKAAKEALASPEARAKLSKAIKEGHAYKDKEMILHSTEETKKVHSSELLEYLKGGWRLTSKSLRLYKGTENKKHDLNSSNWKKEIEKKKEEAHLSLIVLLEDGWQIGKLPKDVVGTEPDGVGEGEVKEYSGEYCDIRKMWSLF